MKQGYLSELKGRQEDLENSKGLLETFYMDPTSEQDLTDDKKAEFQKCELFGYLEVCKAGH